MRVEVRADLDGLPQGLHDAMAVERSPSFYLSRPWFRNLSEHGLDTGDAAMMLTVAGASGGPGAFLALRDCGARSSLLPARRLASMSGVFSVEYDLVSTGDLPGVDGEIHRAVAGAIASLSPRVSAIRIDAMDPDSPAFGGLQSALREVGFAVQPFFHFGAWYEPVSDYDTYLARRPSRLRNTLKRRSRRLEREHDVEFSWCDGVDGTLERALADYESVYERSWKTAERYPDFIAGLVRAAASAGCLRLGGLRLDGTPAAAQVWIVHRGRATIFKLAHDERFTGHSVGTVLTAWMMRRLLEAGGVHEVDYGIGDHSYKRDWMANRRERWGFLAFNPRTVSGALGALRHVGPYAVRRWLGRAPVPGSGR